MTTSLSIITYARTTENILASIKNALGSTDKKTHDVAIKNLQLLRKTNKEQLEAYKKETCLGRDDREYISKICQKIEDLSKAAIGTPSSEGEEAASAPGKGRDESEAAAGAAASGAGRGEDPPKTPTSLVDPDLKTSLEALKETPDFISEVRSWVFKNLHLEDDALVDSFMHTFCTILFELPGKDDAEIKKARLVALALTLEKKDSNYTGKRSFEIDGLPYNYHSLANSVIASKNKTHPDLVSEDAIKEHPEEFIQGILIAKSHLEASTPHVHGAGAGKAGGAAASASAAAAAAAAPSIPKNIHGLQRKGTSNCWAHAMLQFLLHTFGRDELEKTLPDSAIKKTLLEAMLQYQKAGAGQPLSDNIGAQIRRVFATEGVGGVEENTSRQHDATEAIMALFTFRRERADSPITIVHATPEGIRAALSASKEQMVGQLIYSAIHNGGQCPLLYTSGNMELTAFIVHQGGSTTSGHYTAIVKVEKKWYHLDDSSVTELSEEQVKHYLSPSKDHRSTMVFYKRAEGIQAEDTSGRCVMA